MKKYCLSTLLGLCLTWLAAQNHCPAYPKIMRQADSLLNREQYVPALKKLNAAKEYCAAKTAEVDAKINEVVAAIEQKRKQAEKINEYFQFGKEKVAWVYDFTSGKFAVINRKGDRLSEFLYDAPEGFKDGVAIAKVNNQYVFVQADGKEVEGRYDFLLPTVGGFYLSNQNKDFILLDKHGIQLFTVAPLKGSTFLKIEKEKKEGLIDELGNIILYPVYSEINYLGGKISVKIGNKVGLVDTTGKSILPVKYEYIFNLMNKKLTGMRLDGKWGLAAIDGSIIKQPEFDSIYSENNDLIWVKKNDKFGLINNKGKEVLDLKYDAVVKFIDDIAWLNIDGERNFQKISQGVWIVANKSGDELPISQTTEMKTIVNEFGELQISINLHEKKNANNITLPNKIQLLKWEIAYVLDCTNGIFLLGCEDKRGSNNLQDLKWGLVDTTGRILVMPKKAILQDSNEILIDIGKVLHNKKSYFFSRPTHGFEGFQLGDTLTLPPANYWYYRWSSGTDTYKTNQKKASLNENLSYKKTNVLLDYVDKLAISIISGIYLSKDSFFDKFGCVDSLGREVIPFQYQSLDRANNFFIFNKNRVEDFYGNAKKNGKYGILNIKNEFVFPAEYDFIEWLFDGFFKANLGGEIGLFFLLSKWSNQLSVSGGKWVLINANSHKVNLMEYDAIENLNNELLSVRIDRWWGVLDTAGNEVIPIKYDAIENLPNGLLSTQMNGKWGVIDRTGYEVISMKYDAIENLNNGLLRAQIGGWWGVLDTVGNEIIPIKYDAIENLPNGLLSTQMNGKWGVIDRTGNEIIPMKYNDIKILNYGFFGAQIDWKWGVLDTAGNEITPMKYDVIENLNNELLSAQIDRSWGVLDMTGNEIIPIKYDAIENLGNSLIKLQINNKWGVFELRNFDNNKTKMNLKERVSNIVSSSNINPASNIDLKISDLKYDEINSFNFGFIEVKIGEKIGIIGKKNEFLPCMYSNIYPVGYHIFLLEQNGRYGLYAPDLGIQLPCNYEEIGYLKEENGWIRVKQNSKWGWVACEKDNEGVINLVTKIPCRFDAAEPFTKGIARVIQMPYPDHFLINYQGDFLLESLQMR